MALTVETSLDRITTLIDQNDELRARLAEITSSVRSAYLAPTHAIARAHIADALGTLSRLGEPKGDAS